MLFCIVHFQNQIGYILAQNFCNIEFILKVFYESIYIKNNKKVVKYLYVVFITKQKLFTKHEVTLHTGQNPSENQPFEIFQKFFDRNNFIKFEFRILKLKFKNIVNIHKNKVKIAENSLNFRDL